MVIYLEISFRVGTILQVDHILSMFCGSCICFGFKIRSSNGACTMLVVCTCKSFKCICSTGKEGDLGNPTIREQQLLKNIKILPLMRRCRLEMICVGSLWYRRKCVAGAYSSPGAKLRCKWNIIEIFKVLKATWTFGAYVQWVMTSENGLVFSCLIRENMRKSCVRCTTELVIVAARKSCCILFVGGCRQQGWNMLKIDNAAWNNLNDKEYG